jgi:acyl-coenzyme A synthetase/AMP-(fatty) acid ligase
VEFVDELPKSFVGKVLRRILIERESEPLQDETSPRLAPRGETGAAV